MDAPVSFQNFTLFIKTARGSDLRTIGAAVGVCSAGARLGTKCDRQALSVWALQCRMQKEGFCSV